MFGHTAHSNRPQHHAQTAIVILEITTNRYGARPVRIHQTSAVPGSLSRKSPPIATGGTFVSSCGVGGEQGELLAEKHQAKAQRTTKVTKFSRVIEEKERKKGGVMTLVRNNINAREIKKYMEEAEYLEIKVTIGLSSYNIVNFYCPNDKKISLDIIQISDSNFLMVEDLNSPSHSWGYYNTIDKRGETIEDWQDEHHLILVMSYSCQWSN
ncbi:unnamed protein product [Mytilus coruscus]|uniref:Uncharacterized protein n=1 Tax=Mytilus coruscus TaxID=42192 RepID=A0A6J8AWS5_MYTCO|nr:unnamed protein product [Mytilus coruscus]